MNEKEGVDGKMTSRAGIDCDKESSLKEITERIISEEAGAGHVWLDSEQKERGSKKNKVIKKSNPMADCGSSYRILWNGVSWLSVA